MPVQSVYFLICYMILLLNYNKIEHYTFQEGKFIICQLFYFFIFYFFSLQALIFKVSYCLICYIILLWDHTKIHHQTCQKGKARKGRRKTVETHCLPHCVQTCSNLFNLVQTCSSLFNLVQTCSNLFKLVQTCPKLSKISYLKKKLHLTMVIFIKYSSWLCPTSKQVIVINSPGSYMIPSRVLNM